MSSSIHDLAGAGAADQTRDGEHHAVLSTAFRSKALEIARDVSAGATAGGEGQAPPHTQHSCFVVSFVPSLFPEKRETLLRIINTPLPGTRDHDVTTSSRSRRLSANNRAPEHHSACELI